MSGGKKKKSSTSSKKENANSNGNSNANAKKKSLVESQVEVNERECEREVKVETKPQITSNNSLNVDVLDRLAPPILFFPPNVSEEYLNRFCPAGPSDPSDPHTSRLLADEGFPDREIPVMRRLLAMMAGIMSKASAASARTYYSRVAGSEGRRNAYFQQNLNTSVFNLFSTLSAVGNTNNGNELNNLSESAPTSTDLHLTPAAAFTAKDGDPLRGYPQRLMKFWRQLSPTEQVRLVREEHAALTNVWIESRQSWCLCSHCKHRRMTISDLTDCLYQTYCEELEAFVKSNGQGSTLYSPNLNNSTDPSAKMRRFLFKSLSVVGEQALLPRYNQFILRLETFSSMAFGNQKFANDSKNSREVAHVNVQTHPNANPTKVAVSFKSAALEASKEFLHKHKNHPNSTDIVSDSAFNPENFLKGLSFKIIHDSDEELEEFTATHRAVRDDSESGEYSDSEDDHRAEGDEQHQGGIQSEDDDDLIDEETDLPIDESELMLPGGSSFPLLPVGDGPVQWSESSRIECGRTVFLMFASEMFQYRITAAYLAHQTRLRQLQLLAEVEEEERIEKEKKAREEREKKERAENEKKKKKAKREKAAEKAAGKTKPKKPNPAINIKAKQEPVSVSEMIKEPEPMSEIIEHVTMTVTESVIESVTESVIESVTVTVTESFTDTFEPVVTETQPQAQTQPQPQAQPLSAPSVPIEESIFTKPLFTTTHPPAVFEDEDDFDPNELIEQLSKEMNGFELGRMRNDNNNRSNVVVPPGFAPPPGFTSTGPKHLVDPINEESTFYSRPPPFCYPEYIEQENYEYGNINSSGNSDGYMRGGYNEGYYYNHPQAHTYPNVNYHPQVYSNANHQPHPHPQPHPHSYAPHQHQQYYAPPPPKFDPFEPETNTPNANASSDGQSRFQSFFSKSIFGPSSFFSQ